MQVEEHEEEVDTSLRTRRAAGSRKTCARRMRARWRHRRRWTITAAARTAARRKLLRIELVLSEPAMATRRLSYLPEGGGKYFAEGDLALREVTRAIRLSRLPPDNVPLMLDPCHPYNDRYGKYPIFARVNRSIWSR